MKTFLITLTGLLLLTACAYIPPKEAEIKENAPLIVDEKTINNQEFKKPQS